MRDDEVFWALPHAEIRHLKRAPITEAVIDLRVELRPDAEVEALSSLPLELAELYPKREEHRVVGGEFQMSPGSVPKASRFDLGVQGYRYISADEACVAQMRMDGFTFSRLAPYTNWENVKAEAKKFWEVYATRVFVASVRRVALRYINRFVIPSGRSAEEYLTNPPRVPQTLPSASVRGSLAQLGLTDVEAGWHSNLIQAIELADEGSAVVLDIDAYKLTYLVPTDPDTWLAFEELRSVKNRIFFGSVTEIATRDFE